MRTRITAAAAVLCGLALAGAGLTVYIVQSRDLDEQANSAISHEIAEFVRLQQNGRNPATGVPFTDAVGLMRSALESRIPQDNEVVIAFWNGQPQLGQGAHSSALSEYLPFTRAIRTRAVDGGSFRMDTPFGPTLVTVQPVRGGSPPGALAVAYLLRPQHAALHDLMRTYAVVAAIALAIVTGGAWLVSSRLLRPLRHLRQTAQEISDTDLSQRLETTGNDDLTELAETFNAMLDRLERSITTNRRFLDDAGHELRTPITIVRGHLEVLDAHDPADVASARDIALDEIDRMARMVEDLIVLSRADQPDFIRLEPTDAPTLTRDVLDKARALGDREWTLDPCSSATVIVDPQLITQALLQLAKNAYAHTVPGDQIAIGFRSEAARFSWWVRDQGTGIPAADIERIFQRFQRGSRGRSDDGSGLGLAIVDAIARGHDGRVVVESAHGVGSMFTLVIPRGADR